MYTAITKTLEILYQRTSDCGLFTAKTYDMLSSKLNKYLILLTDMYWYASQNIHTNLYIHVYTYIYPCPAQHHNLVRNHIIFKSDNQKWKN